MGRRLKHEELSNGKLKVWLFAEQLENGDLRPFAGSLARTEESAKADLRLAGVSVPGPLLCLRTDAIVLVDAPPDFPVYVGSEKAK